MATKGTQVKVIKPGLLIRSEMGVILDARSTVTLIQSGHQNILVDISLKKDIDRLLEGLSKENLTPNEINIILLTHCHRDHIENLALFTNAVIYAHYACKLNIKHIKIRHFPYIVTSGIEIIDTPGHSWDSITVLVKTQELVYAITGDAIPIKGNYDQWIPPIVHVDAQLALKSMAKIVEKVDIIIPGHDTPFKVNFSSGGRSGVP